MNAARFVGSMLLLTLAGASADAQPEPPPAYPAPPIQTPYDPPQAPPFYAQPYAPLPPLTPTRESRPAVIYGELMGKGLIYSVGFDYAITRWIALGASFSYLDPAAFISPYVTFYPVGGQRSALLLQAGLQLVHIGQQPRDHFIDDLLWKEEGFDVGGQVSIGYEFRAGFVFRVALLAMFNREGVLPWPGLTFGGSF